MPSPNITRSTTTFDDITDITEVITSNNKLGFYKKSNVPAIRKISPTVTPSPEEAPYENISDIFNRRLRTLRRRMQKIVKNEELLSTFQMEQAKLAKQKSNSIVSINCPLDADQLKAIENKKHLNEIINELEHMFELVNNWLSSNPSPALPPISVEGGKSLPKKALPSPTPIPIPSHSTINSKDVFELWTGLSRLENIPYGLIPSEDLLGLKSLNSVIQSILDTEDYKSGLDSIILWMENSNSLDNNSEDDQSNSLFNLCPPYSLVRHCIKKILSSSQEKIEIKNKVENLNINKVENLNINKDVKQKKGKKEKFNPKKNIPAINIPSTGNEIVSESFDILPSFIIPSNEVKQFVPWTGLPVDSAIIKSTTTASLNLNNNCVMEVASVETTTNTTSLNSKKPSFILKKLSSPTPDGSSASPKRFQQKNRHQNRDKSGSNTPKLQDPSNKTSATMKETPL